MRILPILVLTLLATFAGCAGTPAPTPSPSEPVAPPALGRGALPANITDAQTTTGVDVNGPAGGLGGTRCSTPGAQCVRYPFTVNATTGNVTYTATLTHAPTGDYALLLMDKAGTTTLGDSENGPAANQEQLTGTLAPGDYQFVVDTFATVQDPYTFTATFGFA